VEASLVAAERLDLGRRKITPVTTATAAETTAADSPATLLSPEGGRGVAWLGTAQTTAAGMLLKDRRELFGITG
jgi:hypothetical protein